MGVRVSPLAPADVDRTIGRLLELDVRIPPWVVLDVSASVADGLAWHDPIMAIVEILATGDVPDVLLRKIRALLVDAFDGGFSEEDWEHTLGGWHAIVAEGGRPIAHAAATPRIMQIGGRTFRSGYVEAVGTDPPARRSGHGARAVTAVMDVIRREFEIGVLSTSRQAFYERLGWERWQGPTFVIRDGEMVRTEEEDDGIMVLRFGPSSTVSLTEPIACRSRAGDDW